VVYTYNPSIQRVRQEDCEFQASLDHTARPCLKKQKQTSKQKNWTGWIIHPQTRTGKRGMLGYMNKTFEFPDVLVNLKKKKEGRTIHLR
jgi:hypothetical protein